ncbi:MAG: M17 family peptidase N-terminal domain-containing protein, partial [Alphaproteobacteria bacterium]|nr:M17 family peptidase N-terminal domain-containing protein [Alphaproteobacteria bacterium]
MKVAFSEYKLPRAGALVVGVLDGREMLASAKAVDRQCKGALARAMAASRFEGKKGQWLEVLAPAGSNLDRVLLAGLGKAGDVNGLNLEALGGGAVGRLLTSGVRALSIACDAVSGAKLDRGEMAARLAFGAHLASYRFDKYRTRQKPAQKPSLANVTVTVKGATAARRAYRPLAALGGGVFLTRDLVSEPANILYPDDLAKRCRALTADGVKVQVLGEAPMQRLGMGALLGVGQGSARDSRLVVLRWQGGGARQRPIAFVGKGVCFDTGGISIKPAGGMEDMKWDMGGAGVIIGLMRALAQRKAKVNAVGVVGLVENMP